MPLHVNSEINKLNRLLIHSPDSGIGKVVPSKAQDWLFEDIVHLQTIRKEEYDFYVRILLYFLDPEVIMGNQEAKLTQENRDFFIPGNERYFQSSKVLEFEALLTDILFDSNIKQQLVSAIMAIENCSYQEMKEFMKLSPKVLCKALITGTTEDGGLYFPPIPNLIFTRDLGIMINDHFLMNKPAKLSRRRESLLAKFVFFNHPYFADLQGKIIEVEENEEHFLLPVEEQEQLAETLEGGDVMMVAPDHLLIGISERTSLEAARQAMRKLFEKKVLKKVSLVKIPAKRDYMHIDTIFTQVKKNVWVLLASIGRSQEKINKEKIWKELGQKEKTEQLIIKQFYLENGQEKVRNFENLEDLLNDISQNDLKATEPTVFVYSGNNEFPYGAREQWTDSCNLLVLKEGVAIGYDRNDKTAEAFKQAGFQIIRARQLLQDFEEGLYAPNEVQNTIILLPSAELSRARGGSHCMSLPLERVPV